MSFIETVQSIDFSAVGATNILPLDIKDSVVKEKLSVMISTEYLSKKETPKPVLKYSEFLHPKEITTSDNIERDFFFTVKKGKKQYYPSLNPWSICYREAFTSKNKQGDFYENEPVCKSIKPDASFEEISVFDVLRTCEDNPDSVRIEELSKLFHIGKETYSPFKLGSSFNPQQFPDTLSNSQKVDIDGLEHFQRDLGRWYRAGFPRCYFYSNYVNTGKTKYNFSEMEYKSEDTQRIEIPQPVFYPPIGSMAYEIRLDNSLREVRFYRLFLNPGGCGLREALIPVILIQENGYQHTVMTSLPNIDILPLWNVSRIKSPWTDTVVLCTCIQDAETLQRDNEDLNNVAFTSFVDVGENLGLVDFSPLTKKNVVFLISNHNGSTLADDYEKVAKIFEFIKSSNIKIKDNVFIQREVQYPDSSLMIATPQALASTYYHTRPRIDPNSALSLDDETEFYSMLTKIRKAKSLPFWTTPAQQEIVKKSPADGILIRSLLYRNAITVLAGPPSAGKSRFCRSLIRYLVKGNDRKYMKERFWTRCCSESTMKILYWNFDCVPDLDSWKEICLHGLNEDQKQNIFIEDAPTEEEYFNSFSGRPDIEAYRRKIAKYTYKGTPGHPVDLLIVDTLVSVWNKKNIEGSLRFLNLLMKTMPGMAVLAIHHTTELGKPLGGGDPKRMPRIVMTMERINRTVVFTPSKNATTKTSNDTAKQSSKKKTVTSLYKFRYDKFSSSHADIEELPFYAIREGEDMYSVYTPVCTREEMFSSLVYHYRENDDGHPTNKVIGAMLGYSNREVQKKMIDEKKYFAILNKAKKKALVDEEPPSKHRKRSAK